MKRLKKLKVLKLRRIKIVIELVENHSLQKRFTRKRTEKLEKNDDFNWEIVIAHRYYSY